MMATIIERLTKVGPTEENIKAMQQLMSDEHAHMLRNELLDFLDCQHREAKVLGTTPESCLLAQFLNVNIWATPADIVIRVFIDRIDIADGNVCDAHVIQIGYKASQLVHKYDELMKERELAAVRTGDVQIYTALAGVIVLALT